jgi:hypothetical protein
LFAGWISDEDLKGSEAVRVQIDGIALLGLRFAITAWADKICPLENVREEPGGSSGPVAWPGQAFSAQFDLHPKTVLFIMRYP